MSFPHLYSGRDISNLWDPQAGPAPLDEDQTFYLGQETEATAVAKGARFDIRTSDYFSRAPDGQLVPGPFLAPGLSLRPSRFGPAMVAPADGLLNGDEFTISFLIRRPTVDFAAPLRGNCVIFFELSNVLRVTRRRENATMNIERTDGSTALSLATPAQEGSPGVWSAFYITLQDGTLLLAHCESGRSVEAPYALEHATSSSGPDGLQVLRRDSEDDHFELAELAIYRIGRRLREPTALPRPTVRINCEKLIRPWPRGLTGVLGLYTGFRPTRDGVAPDVGVTTRNAQFRMAANDSVPLVRLGGVITALEGAADAPNFDVLDDKISLWAQSATPLHLTLDFGHPSTGGTSADYRTLLEPPTDYALYAAICSKAVAYLKTRVRIHSVGFWNEPDLKWYWTGTPDDFHELWATVQAQFIQDHPDLLLGTGEFATTEGLLNHLDDIAKRGLPVSAAYWHYYGEDFNQLHHNLRLIQTRCLDLGLNDIPIRITEWHLNILRQRERYIEPSSIHRILPNHFRSQRAAAFIFAMIAELSHAPIVDAATVSSLGSVDLEVLQPWNYHIADEALLAEGDPPRQLPAYRLMRELWSLGGTLLQTSTSYPSIRAVATELEGRLTVIIGRYRPWNESQPLSVNIQWPGIITAPSPCQVWRLRNGHIEQVPMPGAELPDEITLRGCEIAVIRAGETEESDPLI